MSSKVVQKDMWGTRKNKPVEEHEYDEYDEPEYVGRDHKKGDIYKSHRECYKIALEKAYNDRIYCDCRFEFKDKLKELGFRWEPLIKKWYIPVDEFNLFIYKKTRVLWFSRSTSAGMYTCYFVNYIDLLDENKQLLEKPKLNKQPIKSSEPDFLD
jgi:hypothetical protein